LNRPRNPTGVQRSFSGVSARFPPRFSQNRDASGRCNLQRTAPAAFYRRDASKTSQSKVVAAT
jgi:hypothetical protein